MSKKGIFDQKRDIFGPPKNALKGQNHFLSQTSLFTPFSQIQAKNIPKNKKYDQKRHFFAQKGPFLGPQKMDRKSQNNFSLKLLILQLLPKFTQKKSKKIKNYDQKWHFWPKKVKKSHFGGPKIFLTPKFFFVTFLLFLEKF